MITISNEIKELVNSNGLEMVAEEIDLQLYERLLSEGLFEDGDIPVRVTVFNPKEMREASFLISKEEKLQECVEKVVEALIDKN